MKQIEETNEIIILKYKFLIGSSKIYLRARDHL